MRALPRRRCPKSGGPAYGRLSVPSSHAGHFERIAMRAVGRAPIAPFTGRPFECALLSLATAAIVTLWGVPGDNGLRCADSFIAAAATRGAGREGARARARCPAAGAAAAVCRRPALPGSPAAARRRRWGSSTCQCCGIDICSDQSGAVRAPQQACHPQLFRARPQPAIGPPPHLLGLGGKRLRHRGTAAQTLPDRLRLRKRAVHVILALAGIAELAAPPAGEGSAPRRQIQLAHAALTGSAPHRYRTDEPPVQTPVVGRRGDQLHFHDGSRAAPKAPANTLRAPPHAEAVTTQRGLRALHAGDAGGQLRRQQPVVGRRDRQRAEGRMRIDDR